MANKNYRARLLPGEQITRRVAPVMFFYRAPRDLNASGLLGELFFTEHRLLFTAPIEPPRQANEISLCVLSHPWLRDAPLFHHIPRQAISTIERLSGAGSGSTDSSNSDVSSGDSHQKRKPLKQKHLKQVLVTLRDFRTYTFNFQRVAAEDHASIARDLQTFLTAGCYHPMAYVSYFPVQYAAAYHAATRPNGDKQRSVPKWPYKLPFSSPKEWLDELLRCRRSSGGFTNTNATSTGSWRVTSVNLEFRYWYTMPEHFVVQNTISDRELIAGVIDNYSRPLFWCWSYAVNGAFICRSTKGPPPAAVPTSSDGSALNMTASASSGVSKTTFFVLPQVSHDPTVASEPGFNDSFEILHSSKPDRVSGYIAQPSASATYVYLNSIRGLTLLDIRRGYDALKSLCTKSSARELAESDAKWQGHAEETWMLSISQCLRCVHDIASGILSNNSYVLVEPATSPTYASSTGKASHSAALGQPSTTFFGGSLSSALSATLASAGSAIALLSIASLKQASGIGGGNSRELQYSDSASLRVQPSGYDYGRKHSGSFPVHESISSSTNRISSAGLAAANRITTTTSWGSSDLSAVVSALVQICCDPYARTIDGFRRLVAKEFVALGHAFRRRMRPISLATSIDADDTGSTDNSEQHDDLSYAAESEAPVLLLFLDCVYQLQRQNVAAFEFSDFLLLYTWDAALMGTHYEFSFDCMAERYAAAATAAVISYEEVELKPLHAVRNPLYDGRMLHDALKQYLSRQYKRPQPSPLVVQYRLSALDIWRTCYLRYAWQLNAPLKYMVVLKNEMLGALVRDFAQNAVEYAALHARTIKTRAFDAVGSNTDFEQLRHLCKCIQKYYAEVPHDAVSSRVKRYDADAEAVANNQELPAPLFVMHKEKDRYYYNSSPARSMDDSSEEEQDGPIGRDRLLTLRAHPQRCDIEPGERASPSSCGRKLYYWHLHDSKQSSDNLNFSPSRANRNLLRTSYCIVDAAATRTTSTKLRPNPGLVPTFLPLNAVADNTQRQFQAPDARHRMSVYGDNDIENRFVSDFYGSDSGKNSVNITRIQAVGSTLATPTPAHAEQLADGEIKERHEVRKVALNSSPAAIMTFQPRRSVWSTVFQ